MLKSKFEPWAKEILVRSVEIVLKVLNNEKRDEEVKSSLFDASGVANHQELKANSDLFLNIKD